MNFLSDISQIDAVKWQDLAEKSPTATWFQTREAYDFYASLPEMMTAFVIAIENRGKLNGVIVGYITKEKNSVKQYFTRRAIVIGGPLLSETISTEELKTLLAGVRELLKNKSIYIETRNFNDYSQWKTTFAECGFAYQPHLNFHIDTSTAEVVEANLGKSRKRDIKASIRNGVQVVENPTLQQVAEYYQILKNLYKTKVKTPLFSFAFFEKLYKLPSSHFILVEMNGEIIGGTVCVSDKRTMYEWFACGKDGFYKNVFPSTVATFSGIDYAANHHFARFDMMGAGKPDEGYGVRDFKAKFGGKLVEYGRFVCLAKPLFYCLGKLGVRIIKSR